MLSGVRTLSIVSLESVESGESLRAEILSSSGGQVRAEITWAMDGGAGGWLLLGVGIEGESGQEAKGASDRDERKRIRKKSSQMERATERTGWAGLGHASAGGGKLVPEAAALLSTVSSTS